MFPCIRLIGVKDLISGPFSDYWISDKNVLLFTAIYLLPYLAVSRVRFILIRIPDHRIRYVETRILLLIRSKIEKIHTFFLLITQKKINYYMNIENINTTEKKTFLITIFMYLS